MGRINQPSNQIKLTNVSIVRLRKGKKRFELACYKNKILEYRDGIEKNLDNVLQMDMIYLNVSKGEVPSKSDMEKAFGAGHKKQDVVREILQKGEIQVSEQERQEQLERLRMEVLDMVVGKVIDPRTKKCYAREVVQSAMDMLMKEGRSVTERKSDGKKVHAHPKAGRKSRRAGKKGKKGDEAHEDGEGHEEHSDGHEHAAHTTDEEGAGPSGQGKEAHSDQEKDAKDSKDSKDDKATKAPKEEPAKKESRWTGVVASKAAKVQALEAIRALVEHQDVHKLPIMRARIKVKISVPTHIVAKDKSGHVKKGILAAMQKVDRQSPPGGENWEVEGVIEPGERKVIQDLLTQTKGVRGKIEDLGEEEVEDDT